MQTALRWLCRLPSRTCLQPFTCWKKGTLLALALDQPATIDTPAESEGAAVQDDMVRMQLPCLACTLLDMLEPKERALPALRLVAAAGAARRRPMDLLMSTGRTTCCILQHQGQEPRACLAVSDDRFGSPLGAMVAP